MRIHYAFACHMEVVPSPDLHSRFSEPRFSAFSSACALDVSSWQVAPSGSRWIQVDPGGSGAGHWESSARLQPSSASSPRSKRESSDGRGDGGLATSSCKSLKPAFWNYHEHPVSSFRHLYYSRCICICYIIYIYNILHIYIIYYIYM